MTTVDQDITVAENPVIFFMNGIGDAFLCLPALRAITQFFQGKAVLICPESHDNWWFEELTLKRLITFDARLNNGSINFDAHALYQLVSKCDVFFSMVSWQSSSLATLISLLSPKKSVGYFPSYDIYITSLYAKNRFAVNFDCVKLLNPFLCLEDFSDPPKIPATALAAAKLFLDNINPDKKLIIGLHMETKEDKMWPIDNIGIFLDTFLDNHTNYIAILISSSSMPIAASKRNNKRIVPVFGFNLAFACALISFSNIFLGVDSCMLHLVDMFRIPGVGLFGPTETKRFGFYFTKHRHINPDSNMSKISVKQVLDSVETLLPITSN